eukprot:1971600-Pleurochrysis_carterae.AAC.1
MPSAARRERGIGPLPAAAPRHPSTGGRGSAPQVGRRVTREPPWAAGARSCDGSLPPTARLPPAGARGGGGRRSTLGWLPQRRKRRAPGRARGLPTGATATAQGRCRMARLARQAADWQAENDRRRRRSRAATTACARATTVSVRVCAGGDGVPTRCAHAIGAARATTAREDDDDVRARREHATGAACA